MITERFQASVLLAALFLIAPNAGLAAEGWSSAQRVTVHADYYVFEGIAFGDLDALEANVDSRQSNGVALDICGATAARALKAVIHRFNERRLDVQYLDDAAAKCTTAVARRVNQAGGLLPTAIDEAAVDRYWRQVSP